MIEVKTAAVALLMDLIVELIRALRKKLSGGDL